MGSLSGGKEQELVSDSTCPVCQDLFSHPHQLLPCRHTLCRKCIQKMEHKLKKEQASEEMPAMFSLFGMMRPNASSSSSRAALRCPICREASQSHEPDETAEFLVRAIRLLRGQRECAADSDCLEEAAVLCPCCDRRLCRRHHEAEIAKLRQAGETLLKQLKSMVALTGEEEAEDKEMKTEKKNKEEEGGGSEFQKLKVARETLQGLEASLTEALQRGLSEFRLAAAEASAQMSEPRVTDAAERAALEADLTAAKSLMESGSLADLARLLPEAKSRLAAAQRKYPQRRLALQFDPQRMKEELSRLLLLGARVSTYLSPYASLPPVLSQVKSRGLTQKPWDIGILTNLEGVVCVDGHLKLASSLEGDASKGKEVAGPLLVINAQFFPTKMLHVTDMEVTQVATIKPQFGEEGMPGRVHVYNERQLILATDAGRHRVFVFRLDGRMVTHFGDKGSGPRQFHSPLGVCAHRGRMYVADAKNRRVQVFDMDNDYDCLASLSHTDLSDDVQSVAAIGDTVFVADPGSCSLFAFDAASGHLTTPRIALESKPFDVVAGEHENVLVTLIEDGRVHIAHRGGSIRTLSFKETGDGRRSSGPSEMMMFPLLGMSGGGQKRRMFHGAAFEPASRRLFIADLNRSSVLVAEL